MLAKSHKMGCDSSRIKDRRGDRQFIRIGITELVRWTFVTTEGIEPTNNRAERVLPPAVLGAPPTLKLMPEAQSVSQFCHSIAILKPMRYRSVKSLFLTIRFYLTQQGNAVKGAIAD
jgi:hypothetical protein